MAQLINEAKRMQFLAGIITESQLNERGDVQVQKFGLFSGKKEIKAPKGKLVFGGSHSMSIYKSYFKDIDEVIEHYKNNYSEALNDAISASGLDIRERDIRTFSEWNPEGFDTIESPFSINITSSKEYITFYYFVDVTEDNKSITVEDWIKQNQPTIYLIKGQKESKGKGKF
jgi:hypothetical protein